MRGAPSNQGGDVNVNAPDASIFRHPTMLPRETPHRPTDGAASVPAAPDPDPTAGPMVPMARAPAAMHPSNVLSTDPDVSVTIPSPIARHPYPAMGADRTRRDYFHAGRRRSDPNIDIGVGRRSDRSQSDRDSAHEHCATGESDRWHAALLPRITTQPARSSSARDSGFFTPLRASSVFPLRRKGIAGGRRHSVFRSIPGSTCRPERCRHLPELLQRRLQVLDDLSCDDVRRRQV